MMKPCKHIAWITFLVGMLLVSPSAYGQVEAQQKASGFDVESLEALDELFQEEVKSGRVIGCQALVCRKGEVCYFKCFGNADQEKNTVMAKDAIFRIYSMSKPITSVAVMMLVEDGKIALDDDVAKYIPEFKDLQVLSKDEDGEAIKVDAEREMTVRDLLRYTSGLTYGFFGNTEVDQAYRKAGLLTVDKNLEEMCQKLSKIPLLYQPGQRCTIGDWNSTSLSSV